MDSSGVVVPGFEGVRRAFAAVLEEQGGGAACAAIVDGTVVCDLWGGTVSADSLVHTWSVIKPVTAAALLLAARRAEVPLETPVAALWPELRAAAEHPALTLAAVLGHRAGLVSVPGGDVAALRDTARTEAALERAVPDWTPATAAGEHALTYGHLVGGLVQRLDGRTIGVFVRDELARPHDLDVHVGLEIADLARVADLAIDRSWWRRVRADRPTLAAAALGRGVTPELINGSSWRRAEVAAVNGHATARGLARFWWLALDGRLPGELFIAAGPREIDVVLGNPVQWTLGSAQLDADDVGMGGVGGPFAGVRIGRRLAWAFLTTVMATHDRAERIEAALLAAVP
jgi:CubicO group peptidase (beta-lactamase class C family)